MLTTFDNTAFQQGIDPIFSLLTPEQARMLAQYQADDELRLRVSELAEKCSDGELTDEERAENEGYLRANRFVSILQAKAGQRMDEALACGDCNLHKGTNLSGIDPDTSQVVMLFDPRRQVWPEQFEWQGAFIFGKTPAGPPLRC